jgi:hypothetical protein
MQNKKSVERNYCAIFQPNFLVSLIGMQNVWRCLKTPEVAVSVSDQPNTHFSFGSPE